MKQHLFLIFLALHITVFAQNVVTVERPNTTGGTIVARERIILKPGFSFKATATTSLRAYIDPLMTGEDDDDDNIIIEENRTISASGNYIITITPLDATSKASIDDNGKLEIDENTRALVNIQYFDGFGRPIQQVQAGVTPLFNDLVAYQEYDAFGRASNSWLPSMATGNYGAFISPNSYKAMNANRDNPYSYPVYEDSPLGRVLEQYGPGKAWHQNSKSIKMTYITLNSAIGSPSFDIPYFTTTDDRTTVSITRSSNLHNYSNAQLYYIVETKDEDGNQSYTATDRLGRVVYTKQMDGGTAVETCYIYDGFGNLRAVLPPLAVFTSGERNESDQTIKDYAYLYKYDSRNRCIAKKLPGAEWIYYIYDNADRLIFTQDGENRAKNEWIFSIPDELGRIAITGVCNNAFDYTKNPLGTAVAKATYYANNGYSISGGFILSNTRILSTNYYDDYNFTGNNTNFQYNEEQGYGTRYETSNKGMLTGTRTAQLLPDRTISSNTLTEAVYYDYRGRVIQAKSNNSMYRGYDRTYIVYNFAGQPTKKKQTYMDSAMPDTEYTYKYDHAGRLIKTTHQLADNKPVTLTENTYDELGRLRTSQKHNLDGHKTTYNYNIRSWVTIMSSPFFVEELCYNTVSIPSGESYYNGNLAAITWQFWDSSARYGCAFSNGYNFYYDNLSRLTQAKYWECGSSSTPIEDQSMPLITYDKHGNITALQRYGNTALTRFGLIDDLKMEYTGNQLTKVTDDGQYVSLSTSMDFKDYVDIDYVDKNNGEYAYNANGAMTKDLNKGISNIQYNLLNLPRQMDIKSPVAEARNEYTYSATGEKLKVVQRWNPSYSTTPVIGSGVNTSSLIMTKTTEYSGDMIFENGALKRILVDGGYIENGVYYFYVTGHLGNNYAVVSQSGEVIQKNRYYPFGMSFASDVGQDKQPYKYNNKELDQMHGLNLYDYHARWYDPTGWFTTMDPLAEKYYSLSPYAFCSNNPIMFIDPDGRDPIYAKNFWGNTRLIGDDGLENNMSYLVRGSTAREVKSATKAGENYTGSLAQSNNVFHIPTGGVMDDVISSVNDTRTSQREHGGHANFGDANATRWDEGPAAIPFTDENGNQGARATLTMFQINGRNEMPADASNVQYWWHTHPNTTVNGVSLGGSNPSDADFRGQTTMTNRNFQGNTFVIGTRTNRVTFFNNTRPLITVKYSDFQRMGGR